MNLDRDGIRRRCEGSLYGFIAEFWSILEPSRPFVGGWAIKAVCAHLEAVTSGKIQYLLITIPPGMMKSLSVAVFWPAWEWGPKRLASNQFLTSSYSGPNVLRDNVKMRRLVTSEKFRALWPEVQLAGDQNAKTRFENTASGYREGRSFGSMTGGRGDRVIIDDPHSVDTAESDVERSNAVTTFRESIPDRLNDMARSAIVVIMQRLHAEDVAGTIIKLGLPYVHLNLPMEYEPKDHCETFTRDGALLFSDPRTTPGELLFPERFSRSTLTALAEVKGAYAYAGQYQQRPTAREGGLFKRGYFSGQIIPPERVPQGRRTYCRAWDFASSIQRPGKSPDASAGVRMFRIGADYFIDSVAHLRTTPGKVRAEVLALAETDPRGAIVRIPQDPGQAGVDQRDHYIVELAGFAVRAVKPTGSKWVRAEPFAVQAEFRHVFIVNGGPIEDGLDYWIEPLIEELCAFPNGAHDDRVDAAADAFTELSGKQRGRIEFMSSGPRETLAIEERDSRYGFGDKPPAASGRGGWGSIPAETQRM